MFPVNRSMVDMFLTAFLYLDGERMYQSCSLERDRDRMSFDQAFRSENQSHQGEGLKGGTDYAVSVLRRKHGKGTDRKFGTDQLPERSEICEQTG